MTLISELSEEALGIRGNLGPISVVSYKKKEKKSSKIVCLLYIYPHWDFFVAEPEIVWFGCARSVLGRAEGASMHRATGPWSLQTAAQLASSALGCGMKMNVRLLLQLSLISPHCSLGCGQIRS